MFKQSLQKLKAEVLKANTLVREANFLAQEMGKQTEFSVTLQIPAANLTPNRKVSLLICTSQGPLTVWAAYQKKVIINIQ